jgi:hypothetical protein
MTSELRFVGLFPVYVLKYNKLCCMGTISSHLKASCSFKLNYSVNNHHAVTVVLESKPEDSTKPVPEA